MGGCVAVNIIVGDTIEETSLVPGGGVVVTATVHSGTDIELSVGWLECIFHT